MADSTDDPPGDVDFSHGQRGRFDRPGAKLIPPVHLEPDVLAALTRTAEMRGVSLSELVNELLRRESPA